MRTSPIEKGDPRFEDYSDVAFIQRNHEIQTFPSCASNQAFTKSIRLGRPVGCPLYSQTQRSKRRIQLSGIGAVAIMNEELVRLISRDTFPKLLQASILRLDDASC